LISGWRQNVSQAFPDLLQLEGLLSGLQGNSPRKPDPERGPSEPRNEARQGQSDDH